MQDYDLKYPGINQQAQTARRNVAQALSNAHNEVNPSKELADFLLDAATKAPGYTKPAPAPQPATEATVKNGDKLTVSGEQITLAVAANALTKAYTLPATAAVVKSGLQTVAATGTGTKVTLTVAGGKITAITLSE